MNLELEWRPERTNYIAWRIQAYFIRGKFSPYKNRPGCARLRTNMAEFQEGAVVCPCTDEKQFPLLQVDIFSDPQSGEFELKGVG